MNETDMRTMATGDPVRVAFFDAKPYDQDFFSRANEAYGFDIKYFRPRLTTDTARLAEGYPAICLFVNDRLDAPTLEVLQRAGLRVAALRCAGYNNVDLTATHGRVRVLRVPAYSPHAVAEHTIALLLALDRKIHKAYNRTRDNNFSLNGLLGFDLFGKTAGIIGTGKIGRLVIRILRGFGMRTLAFDPFPDASAAAAEGFEYVPLNRLYAESDVISLHCPLTPETKQLINADALRAMKPGVTLLNTGRGKLIHTIALIEALKEKRVGAAGLDVYEEEERYFFEDWSAGGVEDDLLARLLTFPNVLVTSHQAFFTREALENIAATTLENIRSFFAGAPLTNEICYRCSAPTCRKKETGSCFA